MFRMKDFKTPAKARRQLLCLVSVMMIWMTERCLELWISIKTRASRYTYASPGDIHSAYALMTSFARLAFSAVL